MQTGIKRQWNRDSMQYDITIRELRKRYGFKTVLQIQEYHFKQGLTWIMGKNGSGKSTLLKIMAGLLAFDGEVKIGGISLRKHTMTYRRLVSFSESEANFPPFLTGRDLLKLFEVSRKADGKRSADFIHDFEMNDFIAYPIQEYSAGMVKKLSLLLAFVGEPNYLMLDEPFITLDVSAIDRLAYWLDQEISAHKTVLLTSHQAPPEHVAIRERCLIANGILTRIDNS